MERALGLGSTCVSNSAPDKRKPIVPYPTEFTLVLRWKRERYFWTLFPIPLFETRRTNWKRCELDNIYQSEVTPRGKVNFAFIFSFRGSFHFFHRKKQDRSFFSLDWLIEGSSLSRARLIIRCALHGCKPFRTETVRLATCVHVNSARSMSGEFGVFTYE